MINGKVLNTIPPAVIKDNADFTATEIDTQGYSSVDVIFALGASDIAMAALKLQESDTAGSGQADITGLVFGTSTNIAGSTSALPSSTDDNKVYILSIKNMQGRKRYLTLVATAGDGSAGTYASAITILSKGDIQPLTAAGIGCDEILAV